MSRGVIVFVDFLMVLSKHFNMVSIRINGNCLNEVQINMKQISIKSNGNIQIAAISCKFSKKNNGNPIKWLHMSIKSNGNMEID